MGLRGSKDKKIRAPGLQDKAAATSKESDLLPGINLEEELLNLEAEFSTPIPTQDFQTTNAAASSSASTPAATTSLATPDANASPEGKPLLPIFMALTVKKTLAAVLRAIMLANVKILESLFTKRPREAAEYLTYLKFLAIQWTRFQTKANLAFDQDYRATKARDNYSWGSNLDDRSAQYFDATEAQCPSRTIDSRGDMRGDVRQYSVSNFIMQNLQFPFLIIRTEIEPTEENLRNKIRN